MKRIVTLQDISCIGRCSTTVALPVISAMGVECGILPTAVLSTHTMFQHFTSKDISDQIEPISEVWEKKRLHLTEFTLGIWHQKNSAARLWISLNGSEMTAM